jgi:hypothetical protein
VRARSRKVGVDKIDVILTGGGGASPFLPKLVRQGPGKNAFELQPLCPAWARKALGDGAAALFPLVAVAIGGVLARQENLERMPSPIREHAATRTRTNP